MKTTFFSLIWLIILFLTSNNCSAQNEPDSAVLYRIETVNGNEFIGNILSQDSAKIYFRSRQVGDISILRTDIKMMSRIEAQNMKNGKYWFENPQSSRYFWAPNGYGLKAGEAYYQNVWVLYNQVSVGLTDYFSIGAGVIPLFLFAGLPTPVWIVLGLGAIVGTVIGADTKGIGIVYGVSTFGDRNNNLSLGLGYGFAGGEWAKTPLVNLSGMVRLGAGTYLVSENYLIGFGSNLTALMCLGGRSIIRRSAGIDYGVVIPLSSGSFFLPWLGITVPFGNTTKSGKSHAQ